MSFLNTIFRRRDPVQPEFARTLVLGYPSMLTIRNDYGYSLEEVMFVNQPLSLLHRTMDLQELKQRLDNRKTVTSIPDHSRVRLFNVGGWVINRGKWLFNSSSYYAYISSLIKMMEPTPGPHLKQENYPIFFRDTARKIFLADLALLEDGQIELTQVPEKIVFHIGMLKNKIDNGDLLMAVPSSERVTMLGLGSFEIEDMSTVSIEDKYLEIQEQYDIFRGVEGVSQKCARIYYEYKRNPSKELKAALKEAYEAIPAHQRLYVLGDQENKDYYVREIIYGKGRR